MMDEKKIIITNENNPQNSVINNNVNVDKAAEVSEYAGELPNWDLLPPAVVIRRVKRSI